jgi:stage II sporulation protein D
LSRRSRLLLLGLAVGWACARYASRPPQAPPATSPPPRATAVPSPVPVVAPTPVPAPAAAPTPIPVAPVEVIAPLPPPDPALATIRVGLATDLAHVVVPCCDGEVTADLGGGVALAAMAPVRVEPQSGAVGTSVFRLQVAALKDEQQARGLATRVGGLAAAPADARFDPGTDLYRVRVGRWGSREEAEREGRRLAQRGVAGFWVVSEGGGVREPALRVTQRGKSWTVKARSLAFDGGGTGGIRVEGRRYRGRIEVFLNDRGTLNVVNELPLEQYLRGVVPREMGPAVFDELEALKAQAVAARTYAIANLAEFRDEGYDICATPRCQVYGGMDDEHPLSDRAVAETAGEIVVFDGVPIDALYSSTCGGHTENVQVVFPLKRAAYLRAVPCLESGLARLAGDLAPGVPFPRGLTVRLAPPRPGLAGAEQLEARLRALAAGAGIAVPADRLRSLTRRELHRYLASLLDLAVDARLFLPAEDVAYLIANPPAEWSVEELQLAAYLVKSGLLAGDPRSELGERESEELLLRLAIHLRAVEPLEGTFLALREGKLAVRLEGGDRSFALPGELGTWRDDGLEVLAGPLSLVAGDRLRLFLRADRLLAVVQQVDRQGVAYDRGSTRASWTRFRSDRELAGLVRARYPGFAFEGFELHDRGASGRVGRLRLLSTHGESVDVEGLAVRWTFDLPDTWFTARRLTPKDSPAGWQFTGRGWGHGVGLCQVGSFGMARRGHGYREILTHYYSGVRVERWAGAVARPSPPPAGASRR